jgi:hypothetical protein
LLYEDKQSPDAVDGWSIGRVLAVDLERNKVEVLRLGSYQYARNPSTLLSATWAARYVDPKDGREIFNDNPKKSAQKHPVKEWVLGTQVMAHGFYITNAGKIPQLVLKAAQLIA